MGEPAELACHELLLRLAGRLPDRTLWRFRDWLAAGALLELSHVLPLTLLRERIGLTVGELRLIDTAMRGQGADFGLLSSIREVDELPSLDYTFTPDPPVREGLGDQLAVLLAALLRGRPAVGEVRATWRGSRHDGTQHKRVLLVAATANWVELTGELQRVQRALGEPDPGVEVLLPGVEPPPYHRAALAASERLCSGAEDTYGQLVPS